MERPAPTVRRGPAATTGPDSGPGHAAQEARLRLTVSCAVDNVRPTAARARHAVADLLAQRRAEDFESAVAEAVANAVEHGSQGRRSPVSLEVDATGGEIVARIRDAGCGNLAHGPLDLCAQLPSEPADERGRGLRLMRRLVDDVRVFDDSDGRVVELRLQG